MAVTFQYQAINRSGEKVSDTVALDDESEVYGELMRRGLTPVRIERRRGEAGRSLVSSHINSLLSSRNRPDPARAPRKQLPFFTSQLAILLETGTPLAASLESIEQQVACRHWRALISQLRQHVEEGGTLASAVGTHPRIFDPLYVSMIAAGERSGQLSAILNRLAEVSRRAGRLRMKIISAMIYPALLTVIAAGALISIIFFVLPRFAGVFEEMKVDLPYTTELLMTVSAAVRQHVITTLLIIAAVVIPPILWLRSTGGRRFMARVVLDIPIAGALIRSIITARMFRLVGLLIDSSVPLVEALQLAGASTKNHLYSQLIADVRRSVLNGRGMFEVLRHSKLVSASMSEMIHTAEDNGQVGKVICMLADHLDDDNDTKIQALTSIMEPAILVFMGLLIGTVAISLVLPMFDLSRISR